MNGARFVNVPSVWIGVGARPGVEVVAVPARVASTVVPSQLCLPRLPAEAR